ncbi:MAG TPA: hypothetical protein DIS96_03825, partial [Pusillimonas sp.]|nr:hypothetical protein [Pusillimonas sp.]
MIRWTDDEGRNRCKATDTAQFLYFDGLRQDDKNLVSWPWLDVWEKDLAIKLITIGFPLDIDSLFEIARTELDKKSAIALWYYDAAKAAANVYQTGLEIANASIAYGAISDPDKPANWLSWAKSKGYSVDHLCLQRQDYARRQDGELTLTTQRTDNQGENAKALLGKGWKDAARTIADEIDKRDEEAGARDGIKSLANRVADKMRERGIYGERGPLAGGTIVRDALQ